jgi:protein-S-isoprenylcysteine O-methyltransferase Ste14
MNPWSICGYLWAAWYVVWIAWAFQSKKTREHEGLASRMSYTPILLLAVWLACTHRLGGWWSASILPAGLWLDWFGIALVLAGFALTFWARAVLGGNWSGSVTIKVEHELIRTGPYRWVRHPIYTGILTAVAGNALVLNEWRGIISLFLIWIGLTIKRRKEEQFMRQTFGAQYDDYAHRTGAIFPTVLRRHS